MTRRDETRLSRREHVVSNPHGRQHGTTGGPYASVIPSPPCRRPGYPHDGVVATRAPYPLLNNGHAPRAIRSVTHAYASGGGYSRVAAGPLGGGDELGGGGGSFGDGGGGGGGGDGGGGSNGGGS